MSAVGREDPQRTERHRGRSATHVVLHWWYCTALEHLKHPRSSLPARLTHLCRMDVYCVSQAALTHRCPSHPSQSQERSSRLSLLISSGGQYEERWPEDVPRKVLHEFVSLHGFQAPAGWPGYRPLTEK